MRPFIALCLVVFAALAGLPARAAESATTRLSLLLICDIYQMGPDADGRGGMALIAGTIAAERARGGDLIVAHAGDTISPSLMSGLDQGAHMIDLLNLVKPDLLVPGNHEFDFGPEVFARRMGEARFPVLAANLSGPDGQPLPGIGAVLIRDFGGVKLAFIGLTADDSPPAPHPAT